MVIVIYTGGKGNPELPVFNLPSGEQMAFQWGDMGEWWAKAPEKDSEDWKFAEKNQVMEFGNDTDKQTLWVEILDGYRGTVERYISMVDNVNFLKKILDYCIETPSFSHFIPTLHSRIITLQHQGVKPKEEKFVPQESEPMGPAPKAEEVAKKPGRKKKE